MATEKHRKRSASYTSRRFDGSNWDSKTSQRSRPPFPWTRSGVKLWWRPAAGSDTRCGRAPASQAGQPRAHALKAKPAPQNVIEQLGKVDGLSLVASGRERDHQPYPVAL